MGLYSVWGCIVCEAVQCGAVQCGAMQCRGAV